MTLFRKELRSRADLAYIAAQSGEIAIFWLKLTYSNQPYRTHCNTERLQVNYECDPASPAVHGCHSVISSIGLNIRNQFTFLFKDLIKLSWGPQLRRLRPFLLHLCWDIIEWRVLFSSHRTRWPAGHHSDYILSNIIMLNAFVGFEKVLQRTVNVMRVTSHTLRAQSGTPRGWGLRPAALGHAELLGEVYTSLLFALLFRAPRCTQFNRSTEPWIMWKGPRGARLCSHNKVSPGTISHMNCDSICVAL